MGTWCFKKMKHGIHGMKLAEVTNAYLELVELSGFTVGFRVDIDF